jgi:glycosyltransferase involved in cell wall biosynthesis
MGKTKILYGLEASGGGALKHVVYLVTKINASDFDITVILSNSRKQDISDEIRKMEKAGAKILLFPMCRNIHPIKDFLLFMRVFLHIKKNNYDIVHAHSSKAGGLFRPAAWLCNVSSICYTPHCFYFQGKTGIRKFIYLIIEKLLCKISTCIIVSEGEKKEIIKNKMTSTSKVVNINNAIDFDEYKQYKEITQTKKHLGIPNESFVTGAIGRLVPQKDWNTYIYAANEVLKTHPNTIFLIVGEGELQSEIQNLIMKLHIKEKIILTGYFHEVNKIYGIIDVFVNTSLWEGLPYVFLEAMKYQKPIISTNTGNDTTIIHEENGFISPLKDYHDIANKITMLIEDKQMLVSMGKKGIELLTQKYSFKLFINKHEELYKKKYES